MKNARLFLIVTFVTAIFGGIFARTATSRLCKYYCTTAITPGASCIILGTPTQPPALYTRGMCTTISGAPCTWLTSWWQCT